MNGSTYKVGFCVLAVVVGILLFSVSIVYYAFDKDPSYILRRVMDATVEPAMLDHVVFLPEYYYDGIDILPYTYSKHVTTVDDFYVWKEGPVLEEYRARPTIHQVPHNYTMLSSDLRDGYTISKFAMQTSYPNDIIFYKLTTPPPMDAAVLTAGEANKKGTILVIPGSGHQGARDVLGEPTALSAYHYQDEIAKRLVMEGYDVYTIELHGYGERKLDVGSACDNESSLNMLTRCSAQKLANNLEAYGIELHTIQTDEVTQVLAHIVYDEGATEIAVVGLSLGAGIATRQAIINHDVVDAVVLASRLGSVANGPISSAGLGLLLCCDTTDEIAALAPMPLYLSFGRAEAGIYGWEANTNHTGDFLKSVYDMHEASDNFYYYPHDGAHEYHVESVIDFLGRHVG